ncbi:hypothetical protein [Paracoccus ravus]|nr:hypothetical protein [Paracoccus ravus]
MLTDMRPRGGTPPLEQAEAAYHRMLSGEATFRMVLILGDVDNADQ